MSALEQTLSGPANTEHHHRGLGLLTPADVHHLCGQSRETPSDR
jgi:hypothetical protein